MRSGGTIVRAALVAAGIALFAGCTTREVIDQTLPPYASTSDAGSEPSSAPSPVVVPEVTASEPAGKPESLLGKVADAIGAAITFPLHMIGD